MSTISAPRTAPYAARVAAAPAPGMHLTARGRRVVAILASALLLTMMSAVNALQASAHDTAPATRTVTVAPGQTLWSLALSVAPGSDPRETVYLIEQLNGMTDSALVDGQRLVVPSVK